MNDETISANERLGLPRSKMRWVVVCFDVDGTLISEKGYVHNKIKTLVETLSKFKNIKIVVWSGGGKDYAARVGHEIGIDKYVWKYASKTEHKTIGADIAIDDIQDTNLGTFNLITRNK